MNRFGAFAIHLGISLVIFLILGYVIVFHWYPEFFFTADGGWQGIRIVAFVDLVLGPVLTLVVFNRSKPRKELRRDLTLIGTFQAVCLAAGVWVVYSERPLAMVYADGSFQTITADDYREANQPIPSFDDFPDPSPHWVSVVLPEDLESQSAIRRQQLVNRRSIKTAGEYYVPFKPEHVNLERDGLRRSELERIGMHVFEDFALEHGGRIEDYIYLPFGTRYEQALMAMRRKDGELYYVRFSIEHLKEE
jgi:hypothetical protein